MTEPSSDNVPRSRGNEGHADAAPPRAAPSPTGPLPPPVPVDYFPSQDPGIGILIPARNPAALWSYYLGIFSLIPCLGIGTGIAAIVLGVKGLKRYAQTPSIRGRTHSWVGVVAGSFCLLVQIALLVALIVASQTPSR